MIVQVTEFRKNTKKYLDLAIAGQPVEIERAGVLFALTSKPSATGHIVTVAGQYTSQDVEFVVGKDGPLAILPEPSVVPDDPGFAVCKNDHIIPEGRSKCSGKGCKYGN